MSLSVHGTRRDIAGLIVATLVTAANVASAQSTDRMHPTPLRSGEVTGRAVKAPTDYWYSFSGGAGPVTLSVDAQAGGGYAEIEVAVKDSLFNDLGKVAFNVIGGDSKQQGQRVEVPKAQPLLLKIHVNANIERFSVAVGGAVDFAGAVAPAPPAAPAAADRLACVPKAGILRIEMDDGSAQEVNLTRARRVFVK
jgi:hypothetical protein